MLLLMQSIGLIILMQNFKLIGLEMGGLCIQLVQGDSTKAVTTVILFFS